MVSQNIQRFLECAADHSVGMRVHASYGHAGRDIVNPDTDLAEFEVTGADGKPQIIALTGEEYDSLVDQGIIDWATPVIRPTIGEERVGVYADPHVGNDYIIINTPEGPKSCHA